MITVTFVQWELASKKGLLQSVDARVKVVCGMLFLAVAATLKNDLAALFALGCFLVLLAALSRIALGFFLRRVCVLAVLFGALVGLPAAFNLVTPGRVVLPIVAFDGPVRIGPFALPAAIGITAEGLTIVARLFLRVADCRAPLSFCCTRRRFRRSSGRLKFSGCPTRSSSCSSWPTNISSFFRRCWRICTWPRAQQARRLLQHERGEGLVRRQGGGALPEDPGKV